jgi:predicted ester cyclase
LAASISAPALAQDATASVGGSCDETQIRSDIQQVIDQGFNQGDTSVIDQIFASDYVDHPDETNRDDFKSQIKQIRTAIPSGQATIDYLLVQGCDAYFKFTETGVMSGALGSGQNSLPATNQPLTLATDVYLHFNDSGQVAEEWDYQDNLPFMTQLGLMPTEQAGEATAEATPEMTAQAPAPGTITVGGNETSNAAVIQQIYGQNLNSGNIDAINSLLGSDYVGYNTDGSTESASEFTGTLTALHSAMPDLKVTINGMVAEGDYVATRVTLTGTFQNDLMFPGTPQAIPATQKPISLEMSFLDRIEDGKIAEDWTVFDNVSFLSQLGLMTNPEATPEATPA